MPANSTSPSDRSNQSAMRLEPWDRGDRPFLEQLMRDPEMTTYLGGPRSDEEIARIQAHSLWIGENGKGWMFKIIHEATGEAVGRVGYWELKWRGEVVYETGWVVLPRFQRQGIASAATAQVISQARLERKHRFLHAFPSVENTPSNALCQKLKFTLVEECEYPLGSGRFMQSNDWRLDLFEDSSSVAALQQVRADVPPCARGPKASAKSWLS